MAEFEEKLNSILGDQNAMSQIMALAQSLSGVGSPPAAETPHPEPAAAPPVDMSLGLNQVDPRLLQLGGRILKEYQRGEDKNTALLLALKPFLRQERYAKVDQAIQLARLARVVRVALESMGQTGGEERV
ncbi:MAG: hypothetical protein MR327_02005 [Clostridiales bacterium]|nr:hypothetical protein [Clostridiales bacterium]